MMMTILFSFFFFLFLLQGRKISFWNATFGDLMFEFHDWKDTHTLSLALKRLLYGI